MQLLIGTSGFSYSEWRGRFYPERLPESEMLQSYAKRLGSVEINNTFYRMPQAALLQGWSVKVPSSFRFAIKAPRSISHIARLKNAQAATLQFLEVAATLGEKLGPLLFQLPPFARKDVGVLREFLSTLPKNVQAAFEFRHASWFDDEVYAALADSEAALVGGDPDEGEALPLVATAPFGYLRLRSPSYAASGLELWRDRIAAQPWQSAYVYLKHEVLGPAYAQALTALFRGERPVLPDTPPERAVAPKPNAAKLSRKAPTAAKKTPVAAAQASAASGEREQAPKAASASKKASKKA